MPHTAVIFDLDGTLLDTLDDIANSAQDVLTSLGLPPRSRDQWRHFVGQGVARLFEQALPDDRRNEELIAQCVDQFRTIYARRWHEQSRPYEGIRELLTELTRRKIGLAVLSNKPDDFTNDCVRHYFADFTFALVFGQRAEVPRKPDPTAALEIASEMATPPEQFLFLGDTAIDIHTAKAAGMKSIGAPWGFRDRAELVEAGADAIVEHPLQLLDHL